MWWKGRVFLMIITNLCVWTDGILDNLRVTDVDPCDVDAVPRSDVAEIGEGPSVHVQTDDGVVSCCADSGDEGVDCSHSRGICSSYKFEFMFI